MDGGACGGRRRRGGCERASKPVCVGMRACRVSRLGGWGGGAAGARAAAGLVGRAVQVAMQAQRLVHSRLHVLDAARCYRAQSVGHPTVRAGLKAPADTPSGLFSASCIISRWASSMTA